MELMASMLLVVAISAVVVGIAHAWVEVGLPQPPLRGVIELAGATLMAVPLAGGLLVLGLGLGVARLAVGLSRSRGNARGVDPPAGRGCP